MTVYDFDGTLYEGDSSVDFFLFEFRRGNVGASQLCKIAFAFALHFFKIVGTKECKETFFSFVKKIDAQTEAEIFWREAGARKLKTDFFARTCANEAFAESAVISASPEFLVEGGAQILGIKNVIATEVDTRTAKIAGENCKGSEKVARFFALFPNANIEFFYSDSKSDAPLAKLAKKAFLVHGSSVRTWKRKKGLPQKRQP
ncbi:MAG: HAD-IB family phosphatase [Bacteroides sp.]|nr:HAD-IB family phosphatase [Prevotella sp.]MCM1408252.1 HAD-IB family phosphatase [Treponema brennaborense]MCM1469576.1 HAD-IB family phosphatase [Bacteroides sp.]